MAGLSGAGRAGRWGPRLVPLALLSPLLTHAALAWGAPAWPAVALSAGLLLLAGLALRPSLGPSWVLLPALPLLPAFLGRPEAGLMAVSGLSHGLVFGGLFLLFAASLRPRAVDVATGLARRLDPNWHEGMRGYARGVTVAWCAFFAAQLLLSAALWRWGTPEGWSLLVNLLDWPMIAAMFLAEHAVRRRRFPGHPHVRLRSLLAALAAAPAAPAGDGAAPTPAGRAWP